jgi:hypothetical protein
VDRALRSCMSWILLAGLAFLLPGVPGASSTARMYFASDSLGEQPLREVREGERFWIVVIDADENVDCDARDNVWADVQASCGLARLSWVSYGPNGKDANGREFTDPYYEAYRGHFPGKAGSYAFDYFEETGTDTNTFVSRRSFQLGTRESFDEPRRGAHVLSNHLAPGGTWLDDFYLDKSPPVFPEASILSASGGSAVPPLAGDRLVGTYKDPTLGEQDIAFASIPVIRTEARMQWDRLEYDSHDAATLTIYDEDENLDSGAVEYVPVFILVSQLEWVHNDSDLTCCWRPSEQPDAMYVDWMCTLQKTGGVDGVTATSMVPSVASITVRNVYHSERNAFGIRGAKDGRYYFPYPSDYGTASPLGVAAASFYAEETGPGTGVFVLWLNNVVPELGFDRVRPRDALWAHYIDPTDGSETSSIAFIAADPPDALTASIAFCDAEGETMGSFAEEDAIFVRVTDPSHSGAYTLRGALWVEGIAFALVPLPGPLPVSIFQAEITGIARTPERAITALYTDPGNVAESISTTAILETEEEADVPPYVQVAPNPSSGSVTFRFIANDVPQAIRVSVISLSGSIVWEAEMREVAEIIWSGEDEWGQVLANGAYVYVLTISTTQRVRTEKGILVILR